MDIRRSAALALLLTLSAGAGCQSTTAPTDAVFQTSTITDLLAGSYDGQTTFAELRRHGDFGIGTVDGLDGEMVADGGRFYQIRSDGKVSVLAEGTTTPFASVKFFRPDKTLTLTGPLTFDDLKAQLDAAAPDKSRFCAFRVRGTFAYVRARSVPRQHKPYPRLVEVVKSQPIFELANIQGVLIGYRLPDTAAGLNVPGYHLHFLSQDRTAGGHVQDVMVQSAVADIDTSNELTVRLQSNQTQPATSAGQLEQETRQVEK
jgi:acetolactate decarboxylase